MQNGYSAIPAPRKARCSITLADYPDIEYVVALYEAVAVGAASFYAQSSGKTAVANLHVAPGLGNAAGMMYSAMRANAPVIITAGQQDTRMRLQGPGPWP